MRPQTIFVAVTTLLVGFAVFAQDEPAPQKEKAVKSVAVKPRSDALWETKVPFEQIPVKITNWSEAKKGLRIGMLTKGEWRQGGRVSVELWIHNQSDKTLVFDANPSRPDVGLWVYAQDKPGHKYFITYNLPDIIATPMTCSLPAGYVAQVKDFSFTFGKPTNDEDASPDYMLFEDLEPGPYQLHVGWADAEAASTVEGIWTGKLAAKEIDFTLKSNPQ